MTKITLEMGRTTITAELVPRMAITGKCGEGDYERNYKIAYYYLNNDTGKVDVGIFVPEDRGYRYWSAINCWCKKTKTVMKFKWFSRAKKINEKLAFYHLTLEQLEEMFKSLTVAEIDVADYAVSVEAQEVAVNAEIENAKKSEEEFSVIRYEVSGNEKDGSWCRCCLGKKIFTDFGEAVNSARAFINEHKAEFEKNPPHDVEYLAEVQADEKIFSASVGYDYTGHWDYIGGLPENSVIELANETNSYEEVIALCKFIVNDTDGTEEDDDDEKLTLAHDFDAEDDDDELIDAATEVEIENAKAAEVSLTDKIKAKISEQKKPRKSVIDWNATFEQMRLEQFAIRNAQFAIKKIITH